MSEIKNLTSKEKTKFRTTKEWKNFKTEFLKLNPNCAFCGAKEKSKKILPHHRFSEDYTNLSFERFIPLCNNCHRYLHLAGQKKNLTPQLNRFKEFMRDEINFGEDWIKF